MKLTVRSRAFPNFGADNRTHFLLAGAKVGAEFSFEDGTTKAVAGTRTAPSVFVVELTPDMIPGRLNADGSPVLVGGLPSKQLLTRVDLDYRAEVTLGGLSFTALRIVQRLQPSPRDPDGRQRADYGLAAGGWRDSAGRQRIANAAVHPLADLSGLATGVVLLNTLMLDITAGWRQLHRENSRYQGYDLLTRDRGLTFKIFAHTAGAPLIWYAVVPNHLRGTRPVSPHVFLQPSDNREGQWPADEARYLLQNDQYFKDDGARLFRYLLAPVPDVQVPSAGGAVGQPLRVRNVVNFSKAVFNGKETGEITLEHWNVPAGMQDAFRHAGDALPSQVLLVPQRVGESKSIKSESYGGAVTGHLTAITNALFGVIETNTDLTLGGSDLLLTRDKLVISAYSESGLDLWSVGRIHRDALKAIIAIEPQALNTLQKGNDYRPKDAQGNPIGPPALVGKEVIPELLKRGVGVFIIGRHHLQRFGPEIPPGLPGRNHLRLWPVKPSAVFRYPPDPSVNDFIKYRVHRIFVPGDDPMLLPDEAAILAALAARGITGTAVLPHIFGPKGDLDENVQDGVARWYSHHFALTGGDEMHLDPSGVYGKPVSYRTWFHVAVNEIG